jgi:endonuclease/exonuclease/phosphatase family metal-dependent hydrolase
MSFNFPTTNLNKWEKIGTTLKVIDNPKGDRLIAAKNVIKSFKPKFICFQETHSNDIKKLLASDFIKSHYKSYAPLIGNKDSETNAIFYSKDYTILDKGVIYLNEKQKKGLNSWDDKHQRVCTWIYVQNINQPNKKFYLFNLHLGLTEESRSKSLKIIYEKADLLRKQGVLSIIAGDFNAKPSGPTFNSVVNYNFKDLKDLTPPDKVFGPSFTYAGYDNKSKKHPDHLIVSMPEKIEVTQFITIKNTTGTRPSDHYPIMATLSFI